MAAKDDDSRSILPKTVAIPMKGNSNRTIGAVAETLNLRRMAAKDDDSNEGKKSCDKMNPIHN